MASFSPAATLSGPPASALARKIGAAAARGF
jgi:hypothetical protein